MWVEPGQELFFSTGYNSSSGFSNEDSAPYVEIAYASYKEVLSDGN